jgi:hypothetical protein
MKINWNDKKERAAYNKAWRKKNAKRIKAYRKAHPHKYSQKEYVRMKRWRKKHIEHYRAYQAAYQRKYIKAYRDRQKANA